ncbi:hypothetical protein VNI00_003776 [Paramarasmius palmivorus]|uniref:Uncharacterized protein n=1 Tax=Paramarasmius palmivorus TaxID=297713 RepID=A0AAW0DKG7_9AGAR
MRFPLLRRLSHLIHRRPNSESYAADALNELGIDNSAQAQYPRSQSLDNLHELCILPPHLLDLLPQHPVPTSLKDMLLALANLERRIPVVELEIAELRRKKDRIIFESELIQERTIKTKPATTNRIIMKGQRAEEVELLQALEIEMERQEDLLGKILATFPPHSTPIFHDIAAAINAGASFENAAIGVLRRLVHQPNSPWSRLLPPVIGERTTDQYASALGTVLKTRKDLKHGKNVAQFWKRQAKLDEANTNLVTPSASTLSEVQIALSEDRKQAVDDLLQKLRSGEIPVRSRVVTQARPVEDTDFGPTERAFGDLSTVCPLSDSTSGISLSVARSVKQDVSRAPAASVPSSNLQTLPSGSELQSISETTNSSSSNSSLAALPSISSSEPSESSTSSFASIDIFSSDIWGPSSTTSLSRLEAPTSVSGPDSGDVSSFPIPSYTRNQDRVAPRISPFGGLETINESEEPSSSSSYYSSSVPSASTSASFSQRHSVLDITLVAASSSIQLGANDVTLVAPDEEAQPEKNVTSPPSSSPSGSPTKRSSMVSRLPRRLSILLSPKKPKKEKGKMVEPSRAKPTATVQRRKPLEPRHNSTQRQGPVNSAPAKPPARTRARANSASARPTISSSLKQAEAQERVRAMKMEKENVKQTRELAGKNITGREAGTGKGGVGTRMGRLPVRTAK